MIASNGGRFAVGDMVFGTTGWTDHYVSDGKDLAKVETDLPPTAVLSVLGDAVAMGGSTLGDAQYVDVAGEGGSFQENHRVYGRAGERCITCRRGVVTSAVVAGRTTSWCRVCQR